MDTLASWFELFAGINAAFIISSKFVEIINGKIAGVLNEVEENLQQINESLQSIKSFLTGFTTNNLTPSMTEMLQKLDEKKVNLENKFNLLEVNTKEKILISGVSNFFTFYSLFAALYCFAILLMIGYEFNLDDISNAIYFSFFSMICVFLMGFNVNRGQGTFKWTIMQSGHITIIAIAIFSIIVSYLLNWGVCYYFLNEFNKSYCKLTAKIIATITPVAHFIYYFIKGLKNRRKTIQDLILPIREMETEINNFNVAARARLDTIAKLVSGEDQNALEQNKL